MFFFSERMNHENDQAESFETQNIHKHFISFTCCGNLDGTFSTLFAIIIKYAKFLVWCQDKTDLRFALLTKSLFLELSILALC